MKYTSAEANKLLKSLNEERDTILNLEENGKSFIAATIEDIEAVRPDYSYADTQQKLAAVEAKIRRVKHAINIFNTTTKVPGFDMTIDEILVYIPQLSARKYRLATMANVLPQKREKSSGQGNIIDYRYANYDVNAAGVDAKAASDILAKVQTALDLVNSTMTMEIEL